LLAGEVYCLTEVTNHSSSIALPATLKFINCILVKRFKVDGPAVYPATCISESIPIDKSTSVGGRNRTKSIL
jgi:hypothetical protein